MATFHIVSYRSQKKAQYFHKSDLLSSFMIDLQSAFSVPTTAINDYVLQFRELIGRFYSNDAQCVFDELGQTSVVVRL